MLLHLALGENGKALHWLEKGYEEQDTWCWVLKVDPVFNPLRTKPRVQALRKIMDLDKRAMAAVTKMGTLTL